MKNLFKKAVGILLTGAMLFSSALSIPASAKTSATAAAEKTYTVKKRSVPTYSTWGDVEDGIKTTLYYVNGSDVPYVNLETIRNDYLYLYNISEDDISIKYEGGTAQILFLDEVAAEFDFANDRITFEDYDTYKTYTQFSLDFTTFEFFDENGNPKYLKRSSEFLRTGNKKTFDLGAYDIDLVRSGKNYLIPLQTYSDIFLLPYYFLCYNGNALFKTTDVSSVFYDENTKLTSLGKKYYNTGKTGNFSKSQVRYAYNELCFAMDEFFGNKENLGITSFDKYIKQTGLYDYLRSTDPKKVDTGLWLLMNSICDIHSMYWSCSYASGDDFFSELKKKYGRSSIYEWYWNLNDRYNEYASKYNPGGRPAYEEIGDTAFITIDEFTSYYTDDYYETKPDANAEDTIGIIGYSVGQILRKNSPIKKVVLDLSCCIGGYDDAAAYVIAAFLGKTDLQMANVSTDAYETLSVEADTNFDGVFNKKDYLADRGLKLYCLVSEASFSNGNKVPAILKNSGKVTLVGRKTSGGAYSVNGLQTAYGSYLLISYSTTDTIMINGTLYNIDAGVTPHIYICDPANLFRRKALMAYLNKLM